MGVVGVGVDLVDVPRFAATLERQANLAPRLFTEGERRDANDQPERLAARFAAKEAVLKVLGVGLGAATWHDIEVVREASGAPTLHLHGAARELAAARGVTTWHLSLTHTDQTAAAYALGES